MCRPCSAECTLRRDPLPFLGDPPETQPVTTFKHHIFVCINQRPKGDPRGCCADNGSERLQAFFKKEVERLGLKGAVRANKAGCLDHCEYGPSVVIYPEGVWYWVGTEADVTEIMERHILKGEIVERLLMPGHTPGEPPAQNNP